MPLRKAPYIGADRIPQKQSTAHYRSERASPSIDDSADWEEARDYIARSLFKKGLDWAYEEEYRQAVDLKDCTVMGSHHYWEIPPDMIKRVILGARCATDPALVHDSIRFAKRDCGLKGPVEVKRAIGDESSYCIRLEDIPE